jgi:hypothetical protein
VAAIEEPMTTEQWLEWAVADAERRRLPGLKPLLEALARSLTALRDADFNDSPVQPTPDTHYSADGHDARHADR